jgi:ubiquinone biosynthesis monooxygenase Coq6
MIKYIQKRCFSLRPDICIVGAGPAGSALACALASSDHFNPTATHKKIVIIDPSRLPEIKSYHQDNRVPEPRVVTLSPATLKLLKSVGALQKCDHRYVTPFTDMLVYEQAGRAYMRFNHNLHNKSILVKA